MTRVFDLYDFGSDLTQAQLDSAEALGRTEQLSEIPVRCQHTRFHYDCQGCAYWHERDQIG